ncbi:MAG: hypothetical protein I8H75_01220 [Myxococcaceae bacterium]|nr:hypothetical protein [Myxococcaceae bacterium]
MILWATVASCTSPAIPVKISFILAGLAVFHLKFPSLLQYDQQCRKITGSNLKTLYRVQNLPCDTTLRERLDELSSKSLRGIFKILFAFAQRGKILESCLFWNQSVRGWQASAIA